MPSETFVRRWLRRSATIPMIVALWAAFVVAFPAVLGLAVLSDLPSAAKWRWARTRASLFFLLYLSCELFGLLAALGCWLLSGAGLLIGRERFVTWNSRLQGVWLAALFRGALRIYGMSIRVEGSDCASRGPLILFLRHASTADTVLAGVLVANPYRIRLRYLLKKELLWDPCLDVVGNRLPNVFLDRSGAMRARELAAVRALAQGLGERDGMLIYPEGTRFSPAKRERVLAKLSESGAADLLARARTMQYVLPPRPGGALALLDAAPEADAVFAAHTGFEGAARFSEFFGGALVRQPVEVRFWRIPATEIPREADDRVRWLFDQWIEVDRWIAERGRR